MLIIVISRRWEDSWEVPLLSWPRPCLISEATAKLSSQEVHFFNSYYYLRRL